MTEAAACPHLHAVKEKKINTRTQPGGTRTEDETYREKGRKS
jgi:hypothetical protein